MTRLRGSAEAAKHSEVRPHVTQHIARAVSLLLSPVTLPPVLVAVVLFIFRAPVLETVLVAGGVAVLLSVVPAAVLVSLVHSGRARTIDVAERRDRRLLFHVALLCGAACYGFVAWTASTAAPLLLLAVALYLVNVALLFVINMRWKISLHSAAISGFFLIVAFASLPPWTTAHRLVPAAVLLFVALAVVSLVAWARVYSGNHTTPEVLAGVLFGIVVPAAEIAAAVELGLLSDL